MEIMREVMDCGLRVDSYVKVVTDGKLRRGKVVDMVAIMKYLVEFEDPELHPAIVSRKQVRSSSGSPRVNGSAVEAVNPKTKKYEKAKIREVVDQSIYSLELKSGDLVTAPRSQLIEISYTDYFKVYKPSEISTMMYESTADEDSSGSEFELPTGKSGKNGGNEEKASSSEESSSSSSSSGSSSSSCNSSESESAEDILSGDEEVIAEGRKSK